ncbi:ComF family protein [Evansella sp. AB-P1]|uniref:ComF family protein n=1 Tax=Evansella sp. AB-P1 TaxID=3037653 RepID=UPI00241CE00A|nr:ComF family protein [Evansella sp. AB-P1]MDG5786680.1 ComF family protein [Evansella sp. AB-P1]
MSSWRDLVVGTENCLWCDGLYDGMLSWTWAVGLWKEEKLCPQCYEKLEPITEIACEECGRPASSIWMPRTEKEVAGKEAGPGKKCFDCIRWAKGKPWDECSFQHRALYVYNPFMQELLSRFKYRGDVELATIFQWQLKKLARKLGTFEIVTTIPLKDKRHWERGFNQGDALSKQFSTTPLLQFKQSHSERKQSKRSREERIRDLKGVFQLKEEVIPLIKGKEVLIIDDIYTTGATLRSAAETLYCHGAKRVCTVTVARSTGELKVSTDK